MFITSVSVSPNRDIVTSEILSNYLKRLLPYLDANTDRYVCSLEKGSREFENHIQVVCESKYEPKIIKQYLDRNMNDLPGYHKGKKGYKDGSTVTVVNRTKDGVNMFGYPLKERPETVYTKGITSSELEQFRDAFAQLPNMKVRRNSTRAEGVNQLINLLWKKMVYYETKETYYFKESNNQKKNIYLKNVYNIESSEA